MTRTKRIYNKRPLLGGPGLKGWVVSNRNDPVIMDIASDYVFRPHGYYCMGNCPSCKRRNKMDQKRKTAKKTEEAMVRYYESDTYYFMWNWGWEDVLDGLFGEFMAEKEINKLRSS